ncbi:MAG: carboxymuconolactone decarboxylase family protein [Limisphaerales bacterium]
MNTVQNGKGDHPRNNWGPDWYANFEAIKWRKNGENIMFCGNSTHPAPVRPETWTELQQLKVSPMEAPLLLRGLSKSLAAMRAYADASHALAHGQLTARQRQQIALTVAEINGCGSRIGHGVHNNGDAQLSETEIELARRASAQDAREDAMLHFTRAVVLQRGAIRDKDLHAVRSAGFSESELIEIVANIALNIFTDYLSLIPRTEGSSAEPSPSIFGTETAT